jgi:hypothetical protein
MQKVYGACEQLLPVFETIPARAKVVFSDEYAISEAPKADMLMFGLKRTQVYSSGSALQGVGLRSLGFWDRGFESRSGHGCLSLVFICCVVLCR